MNLFHLMLIFLALVIALLAKLLPRCAYFVAQWNLPSPPFASVQDYL